MTSKTFKNVNAGAERDRLVVAEVAEGVNIHTDSPEGRCGVSIAPSDAPALALSVLEAAFGDDQPAPNKIGEAWAALYVHIAGQERATEAKEQAELEAEALELFNVNQGINLPDWGKADRAVISSWVRVARRAREMRAEK